MITERLNRLRGVLAEEGVQAFCVPSHDPHGSEYLPECWKRRAWISGFTGSAGDLWVTPDAAALWTDARYFLQAEEELKGSGITLMRLRTPHTPEPEAWLGGLLPPGAVIGFDPDLASPAWVETMTRALEAAKIQLRPLELNPVDRVWGEERPALPSAPLRVHPSEWSGQTVGEKHQVLMGRLQDLGAEAHLVVPLDAVAWLSNLRGRDVTFNPVFIAHAGVDAQGITLFVRDGAPRLEGEADPDLRFAPATGVEAWLEAVVARGDRVLLDPAQTPWRFWSRVPEAQRVVAESPLITLKGSKNEREIEGMRRAHVLEGISLVRFLSWLDDCLERGEYPTEWSLVEKMEEIRGRQPEYLGPSFGTIAAAGPHAALPHHQPSQWDETPLSPDTILLLDTGGQYLSGTTDATRTLSLGEDCGGEHRRLATLVLKAHLSLAMSRFPDQTSGVRLDALARLPLWREGLDFSHGTGHGLGAALCVHESPPSISFYGPCHRAVGEGMIASIEPALYFPGSWGCRLENVVLTRPAEQQGWLCFETLTLCPFDRRLLDPSLLNDEERDWVDAYHRRVYEELSVHLNPAERAWLKQACRPLSGGAEGAGDER